MEVGLSELQRKIDAVMRDKLKNPDPDVYGSMEPADLTWADSISYGLESILESIGAPRTTSQGAREGLRTALSVTPLEMEEDWRNLKGNAEHGTWGDVAIDAGMLAAGVVPFPAAKAAAKKAVEKAKKATPKKKKPKKTVKVRSTELPNLRGMDVDEAIAIARKNPHLIKAGEGSEGAWVGAPRNMQTRQDLTNQRRAADRNVEAGAEGGDWYDRYRGAVGDVTGGSQQDMDWMTNMHGQYSAGVSPEGELGFVLRDLNSGLADGRPMKPARPAQQAATIKALDMKDPTKFQLGKKTGEYARRVNPRAALERTATGVNDFRHARTLGYTEADGSAQRNGIGNAAHTWSDYETALMVDRANKKNLAGRSNWTGEQIQAAPWVKQKADDFYKRQRKGYDKKAIARLQRSGSNMSPDEIERVGREIAFEEANRTIGDFFPKHTGYGTWESQPFVDSGQMGDLKSRVDRQMYMDDPRSGWDDAAGRDEIYAGYREPGTGYAMRVRPGVDAQGVYTPPGGALETNPSRVARPLIAHETVEGVGHSVPRQDRALMDAAEATRAYVDVQGAGAWHKPVFGGVKVGDRDLVRLTGDLDDIDEAAIEQLRNIGEKYGLPDVSHTGDGVTLANFMGEGRKPLGARQMNQLSTELDLAFPNRIKEAQPGRVESGYIGYEDAWRDPNKGNVTREFLDVINNVPAEVRKKLNANAAVPRRALDRLSRDAEWSKTHGINRQDVQNAREIIGQGPGWIDRLEKALKAGTVLPAVAFAVTQLSTDGPQGTDRTQPAPGTL